MKDFISSSNNISDIFLNNFYQIIMKTALETGQNIKDQQSQNMLNKIKEMVLIHQSIDEKENQEADQLLTNI
jgi:hypothetical protein